MIDMGVNWKFIVILSFLAAMKIGYSLVSTETKMTQGNLMDELQSLLEVQEINQAPPFQYHLYINQ
ncbi:MAG: hypothetical protein KDD58_02210 [Bdellovibrionales bacterium]|nr:hypothetical protein [Bdellovibrionales bacterium]